MENKIEFKVRLNIAIIFLLVVSSVAAMSWYLHKLHQEIALSRNDMEQQQIHIAAINELFLSVNHVQSLSTIYLSTLTHRNLKNYLSQVDSVSILLDSMILMPASEQNKLITIKELLFQQKQNIKRLNNQYVKDNPVKIITQMLKEYEKELVEEVSVINIHTDTLFNTAPKKNFFKRLGEVFKPSKDSLQVITTQRYDTVTIAKVDSLPIISEVEIIVNKATETYETNMTRIGREAAKIIVSDRALSEQISILLMEVFQESLNKTQITLSQNEKVIYRNYLFSAIGGVIVMVLILILITLIILDINRGRRNHNDLKKANQRTMEIMESRHKLLLSVSHDIKTPLNSIQGYLELMSQSSSVTAMKNASQHILSMLENLLEFSSIDQGKQHINLSDFSIQLLAQEIYEMFLPLANQKGLQLRVEAPSLNICSDRVKLKQLIINLISNAIKYTPAGEVSLHITCDKDVLAITIVDTGVGIPLEKQEQLFLPFSRLEEHHALASGTGLGLYVVKGILELLQGSITLNSQLGEGSCFTVQVPITQVQYVIPIGKKRVRVIDDEVSMVALVTDMLVALGHEVTDQNPELIITDMEMGDITGDIILKHYSDIPVILMTGRPDFTTEKAEKMGFAAFLSKPISLESLKRVVGVVETEDEFFIDAEVLELFKRSTQENVIVLHESLLKNDFQTAQAICHKMYPMFAHLGYPTEALRRMDMHRNEAYKGWQADVTSILEIKI